MRLSNKAKQKLAVELISHYLIDNGFEHLVFSTDKHLDIYVPGADVNIKVFCNYTGSNRLKVSSDFESQDDVMYLIVKPTNKNVYGFTCLGGNKLVIDKAVNLFNTKNSPKDIQIELLHIISIKKLIEESRRILQVRKVIRPSISYILQNLSTANNDKYNASSMGLHI